MQGVVLSVTRRHISICDQDETIHLGKAAKRELEPIVGDNVEFEFKRGAAVIQSILPRQNNLRRCYFGKEKSLATNLDLLLILAAPPPLWNPTFIDRAYAAALSEHIPCALILNKSDLDPNLVEHEPHIKSYQSMQVPVFSISAKHGDGIEQLTVFLENQQLHAIALTGVSGVGKSTLLNRLIPDALHRTQTVSEKTGQGRQTTSQSFAYLYPNQKDQKLLIDLPGIQNYGISHLDLNDLLRSFLDLQHFAQHCRFVNCTHRAEQECAVKTAVETGQIAKSRFDSYLQMRQEIEESNSYD